MYKWFENLLDIQYNQLLQYLDSNQITIAEFDAANSLLMGLRKALDRKKQNSFLYRARRFFGRAK